MATRAPRKDRYRMFGEVALEQGFVTASQLYEALTVQARRKAEAKPDKLLGQILLELGYMGSEQVQAVIDVLFPVDAER
ncbi:MAG: hypothetical protein L0Z55_03925 [Planctomycetes bacterium]|nr:hypothetical protein [Planctomycetota bacterium]